MFVLGRENFQHFGHVPAQQQDRHQVTSLPLEPDSAADVADAGACVSMVGKDAGAGERSADADASVTTMSVSAGI